jgi:hypothetical protein
VVVIKPKRAAIDTRASIASPRRDRALTFRCAAP